MEKEIINKIKEYQRIIIHGHKRPDGDCYGSMIGLKNIIKESFPEKEVYISNEEVEYLSSFLGHFPYVDDSLYENSLVICVDTATAERVSDKRFRNGNFLIKIDHHIPIDNYGDINYVVTKPSCSQLIAKMAFDNGLKLNYEGARAMYTGIITDTGRFRFRGVDQETLHVAGDLLSYGVLVDEIDNNLSIETIESIKFKAHVLSNMKFTENGVVYFVIPKELIEEYHINYEDAANTVTLLGNIKGYPVWFILLEYPDDLRLRIRSRGPEVDLLANKYEGGGHKKAAGARLHSFDELGKFVEDIDKLTKEYKEENKDAR